MVLLCYPLQYVPDSDWSITIGAILFNWRWNVLSGARKLKASEFKSKIEMPS